jgi:DnaD/phage-associated family protein
MAAKYWLKLYYEMLDDPKIGQLRPTLRWRFIECLLVAGECDERGFLPPSAQYAWRVRANPEIVDTELTELAQAGLLSRVDGRWFVTNFAKRQAPVSGAERVARFRDRQRKADYYEDETQPLPTGNDSVTKRYTDTDVDTDVDRDTDVDAEEKATATAFAIYQDEIGSLSKIIADKVGDAVDEFSDQWVVDAIGEAVKNNVRKWSYVKAILDRWKTDGRHSRVKGKNSQEPEPKSWAALRAAKEKLNEQSTSNH